MNSLSSRPPLNLDTLPPPGSAHAGGRLLALQASVQRERVLVIALTAPELDVVVGDPGTDVSLLLAQTAADVLLLDRALPDYDAICRSLKTGASRAVPIVVVDWEEGGEVAVVEALEAGADEFVTAPLRLHELRARIQNQLRNKRRIDIMKRLRAERDTLRTDVRLDALTSVLNRKALDHALAELEGDDDPVSVVFLDLDYFKSINDTFGHSAGDRALTKLGRLLADHVRPNDIVGRYGGEEFLVVLRQADCEIAGRVAERIRQSIAAMEIPGILRSVTVSAGIACRSSGEPIAELVTRADFALYAAKRSGRDRVVTAPLTLNTVMPAVSPSELPIEEFVTGIRKARAQPSGICAAE
jgi:two-component system, cell cycle response regulator